MGHSGSWHSQARAAHHASLTLDVQHSRFRVPFHQDAGPTNPIDLSHPPDNTSNCTGLHAIDGFNDLTVRESRLLHAADLLNEKILLPATTLSRGITLPSPVRQARDTVNGVRCRRPGTENGHAGWIPGHPNRRKAGFGQRLPKHTFSPRLCEHFDRATI
ncbi:hypothetical protein D3C86_1399510 [compost metagenome]